MRRGGLLLVAVGLAGPLLGLPRGAAAATYAVGPGRRFPDLASVARVLAPGDRVEVDGGVTYPGDVVFREAGTREAPITIVGLRSGERRPVIEGGATTVELRGDHYVFEGFEVTGNARQVFSRGQSIVEHGKFIGRVGRGEYLRREVRAR